MNNTLLRQYYHSSLTIKFDVIFEICFSHKGMYEHFSDLKKINPALKNLLAVGGWTHASKGFTEVNGRSKCFTCF